MIPAKHDNDTYTYRHIRRPIEKQSAVRIKFWLVLAAFVIIIIWTFNNIIPLL